MEVLVKCITKTISITELQKSFQVLYEVKISNAIIFPHFFFSYAPPVLHMAKIQYDALRHKLHIEIYQSHLCQSGDKSISFQLKSSIFNYLKECKCKLTTVPIMAEAAITMETDYLNLKQQSYGTITVSDQFCKRISVIKTITRTLAHRPPNSKEQSKVCP